MNKYRRPFLQLILFRNLSNGIRKIDKYVNKSPQIVPPVVSLLPKRSYNSSIHLPTEISSIYFEQVCNETLESLSEFFEELIENTPHLKLGDVNYGNGVLTVKLGNSYGTYVINRQSPNKQIWLSSPISGPKRYDFIPGNNGKGQWVYKHDGYPLHKLLSDELSSICKDFIDLSKLAFAKP